MRITAIIIPCYNEENRLQVNEFVSSCKQNPWLHYIFVNDGSTDNTMAQIKNLSSLCSKQIHYIDLEYNMGKAMAVWRGFQQAFDKQYENIGFWDADLATPLPVIEQMCSKLSQPQITMIFGSRVRLLNRQIERKAMRHYLGRIFATAASMVLGLTVYDTQCGAKIFKNTDTLKQVFKKPFKTSWIFDVEIFARLSLLQKHRGDAPLSKTAIEYPLHQWYDMPGSKLNLWDFCKAAYELMTIGLFLRFPGDFFKEKR